MATRAKVAIAVFVLSLFANDARGQAMTGAMGTPDQSNVIKNLDKELSAGKRIVILSPKISTRPSETHAALLLSNNNFSGDLNFSGRIQTVRQLRTISSPNPWECAWIVWNYHGGHFYYVALKTNGWEIGKYDHAIAGQQRFLKTGNSEFAVGTWHDFEITQRQAEIQVRLDGVDVATLEDTADPYNSGKIGFYTEDAEIQIGDISAPFKDDFSDYPLRVFRGDGQIVKNWSMPFLGHGYAAIAMAKK